METLIGICGTTIILLAFILNQLQKLDENDIRYDILNFIGAALLVWYAYLLSSYPFLVLNSVWAIVSLKDILHPHKQ
jgi:hypothetical protein